MREARYLPRTGYLLPTVYDPQIVVAWAGCGFIGGTVPIYKLCAVNASFVLFYGGY